MKELFATYKQSLALKELGFDEPCIASWNFYTNEFNYNPYPTHFFSDDVVQLPLKAQVFKWARENHDLFISINHYNNGYSINDLRRFDTYEEAENACIDKLIEIIQSLKQPK